MLSSSARSLRVSRVSGRCLHLSARRGEEGPSSSSKANPLASQSEPAIQSSPKPVNTRLTYPVSCYLLSRSGFVGSEPVPVVLVVVCQGRR